jgi:hypothetical protein
MSFVRPAAYPPNAPVADLRTAELFVLCAVRLWVARFRDPAENGVRASRDLERGFAAAAVADQGLVGLCRFFDVVVATVQKPLDMRCLKCPALGEDEGLLLQAVSLLQHGPGAEAATVLREWLPPAALRLALRELAELAGALMDAGLVLPRRHAEAAFTGSPVVCTDRGVALVH